MKPVVCFGEMLLRISAPGRDPLLRVPALEAHVGGAEANVAVSLACFGHATRMVTVLPDNPLGDACIGELRRHGVDTSAILRTTGRLGLYFLNPAAMLRPAQVIYDRAGSAFAHAAPSTYDWTSLLRDAGWLHLTGITPALSDATSRALDDAMTTATRLGVPISFDCNFRPSLWRDREAQAVTVLREFAQRAQLLLGGALDVAKLFGQDYTSEPPAAAFELAAGAVLAACPRVERLAATHRVVHSTDHHELTGYLADRQGAVSSRMFTLNPIVDRIGGGDAYAAGVIHGLRTGLGRQQIVDFAAAAGALKHSISGDFSIFSAADVTRLLDSGGSDVQR